MTARELWTMDPACAREIWQAGYDAAVSAVARRAERAWHGGFWSAVLVLLLCLALLMGFGG